MFSNLDRDETMHSLVWLMGQRTSVQTSQQINKLWGQDEGGGEMKAGGSQEREGSRGGEASRREMMNHYKGKEKSKWKWGATKVHSGLPLDEFESQARVKSVCVCTCVSVCVWGRKSEKRERGWVRSKVFNFMYSIWVRLFLAIP